MPHGHDCTDPVAGATKWHCEKSAGKERDGKGKRKGKMKMLEEGENHCVNKSAK